MKIMTFVTDMIDTLHHYIYIIIIITDIIIVIVIILMIITIFILNVSTECPAIFPLVDREESSKEEILSKSSKW